MVARGSRGLGRTAWPRQLVAVSVLTACLGERPLGVEGRGGVAGDTGSAGSGGETSNGGGGGGGGSTSVPPDGGVGGGDSGDAGVMGGLVAAQVAFSQLEALGYASTPLGFIAVSIQDVDGILVSAAEDTVTLALANNPGGANLIGYLTAQARGGVAVFDTVGLDQVGTGYTFTASAAGLSTATSQPFDVAPLPFERVATGLYGGIASHLALSTESPPTLFVTGPAGVFRSTNGGGSWAAANFGNAGAVGLVAVDPSNPLRVYTTPSFGSGSFSGSGFYVTGSDSGGDAWRPLEGLTAGGLSGAQVGTFVVDPSNPSILYAGNFAGIFRSTNGGDTWVQTSFAFANYALTIDPIAPTTLYAYASGQGIYKTVDSGNIWAPVNNPSLPEAITTGPTGLLATPTGVFVNEYRSTDGGASWTAGELASAYAYAPSNVQRVYSGRGSSIRVSNDGGETFGLEIATGGVRLNSLAVDTTDADRVYAATDTGVFASTDGGANWVSSSIGISALQLGAVAMNPATPDTVLVGGPTGVYRTTNGGVSWLLSELSPFEDLVTALSIDPVDPDIVYACTLGATFYRSDNGGVSWNPESARAVALIVTTLQAAARTCGCPRWVGSGARSTVAPRGKPCRPERPELQHRRPPQRDDVIRRYQSGYVQVHQYGCRLGVDDPRSRRRRADRSRHADHCLFGLGVWGGQRRKQQRRHSALDELGCRLGAGRGRVVHRWPVPVGRRAPARRRPRLSRVCGELRSRRQLAARRLRYQRGAGGPCRQRRRADRVCAHDPSGLYKSATGGL